MFEYDHVTYWQLASSSFLLLPKLTTKEHFFVSRLVVFNETFASLKGDADFVMLWHEGIAGRVAANVASSFIKCINTAASAYVTLWADNCAAQNKNWTLFTALSWCVNQEWGPEKVTLKFVERGHTFMRADSLHGNIGAKMKKHKNICTFDDFVDVCRKASKKINPVVMQCEDFFCFEDGYRSRQSKKVKLPLLSDLCQVEFKKGRRSMLYKTAFDEDAVEVEFLKPQFNLKIVLPKMTEPRGVSSKKYKDILKLTVEFSGPKRKFLLDLPCNDRSTDLTEDFQ